MTPDAQRKEDCRFAVRRALYASGAAAIDADSIRHKLTRWGEDFTNAEIEAAAAFLCGMAEPQAKEIFSGLGATKSWQITSAGMLAYERNA
jgi:hypothetical protein